MTLILWKAPVVDDPDEASRLLQPWYESENESAFEPSPDIATIADELRRLYPYRELTNEETVAAMSEEERAQYTPEALGDIRGVEGGEPWADLPFHQTDRLLALDVRWGADDAVIAAVVALARKYELVLFDPQGPDIFLPTDPIEELTDIPEPSLWEWTKAIAIAAVLVGATSAAWLIPWGWLRWPVVIIVGFVALAAIFVVGCMIFGRQILEKAEADR